MALALTCHPQRTHASTIRTWTKLNKHLQMSPPLNSTAPQQTLQHFLFFFLFLFFPHTFGPILHCFCRWVMFRYKQPLNETHMRHDIAPAHKLDNQMDGVLTCDPRGGQRTQPLCLLSISCMGPEMRTDWAVEISGGLTGDNRLSIGKLAQPRNSFAIRTRY